MGDKDRFIEELLDFALAHHRAAEPRPGLEARMIERVRAAAAERDARTITWKLWMAATATAVVVVFVAIRVANRPHSPAVETSQTAKAIHSAPPKQTLTVNSGTIPKAGNATTIVEPKRIAQRENKPSLRARAPHWPSQFPTPAPLTAEQKALVQYVRETPPAVLGESILKVELTVQHVEIKPLEIPPLEMKPLAPGTGHEELQ